MEWNRTLPWASVMSVVVALACDARRVSTFSCRDSGDCAAGYLCIAGECATGGSPVQVSPTSSDDTGSSADASSQASSGASGPSGSSRGSSGGSSAGTSGGTSSRPSSGSSAAGASSVGNSSSAAPTCGACVDGACDTAVCMDGVCTRVRREEGFSCGNQQVCNAAGLCVPGCSNMGQFVAEGAVCSVGSFCQGDRVCRNGTCGAQPGCAPGDACDEQRQLCGECLVSSDCGAPDLPRCDVDTLLCVRCVAAADCDDGLFCNGPEGCENNQCTDGAPPCQDVTRAFCSEETDRCEQCNAERPCAEDDNLCNGTPTCSAEGTCSPGDQVVCPSGQLCVPATGLCRCNDGSCPTGQACDATGGFCVVTVTIPVASSADDALQDPPASNATLLTHPWVSLYSSGHWGGFRFALTGVPRGATVVQARLQGYIDSEREGLPNTTISLENSGNAPAFEAVASNISSRTRASTSVPWALGSGIAALPAGWADTPDLSQLVKQFVDRPDYQPGNHLVLIFNGPQGGPTLLEFRQWDHVPAGMYAARLVVSYRAP